MTCKPCGAPTKRKDSVGKTASKSKSEKGKKFDELAKLAAVGSGKPVTFLIAIAIIVIWAVLGPIFKFNDTWQLVINTGTTIITFLMVFLIQNSQNRDSCAVQIKLDEIIRSLNDAENNLMDLEDKSEEELEELKKGYLKMAHEAVTRIDEHKESREEKEERESKEEREPKAKKSNNKNAA